MAELTIDPTLPVLPALPVAHVGHGVALFDLDRTLIPGSSLVMLGRELLRRGVISRSLLARHAASAARFRRRGLDDGDVGRVTGAVMGALAGRPRAPIAAAVDDVADAIAAAVYREARWLLGRHVDAGEFCVLLTAAPQELADAVAARLGLHRAVGTRLETHGGRFTGAFEGLLCYGPGKLLRLRQELGWFDLHLSTAYADSASDIPVLRECATAVAVNPDRRLLAVARESGWPVLRFA